MESKLPQKEQEIFWSSMRAGIPESVTAIERLNLFKWELFAFWGVSANSFLQNEKFSLPLAADSPGHADAQFDSS